MPQSLAKVYIHLIFSTKHREPTLAEEWREELFSILGGIANDLDCRSLVVGGVADHIHMAFRLSRTIALAEFVNKVKSVSSLWINQTRGLPIPFQWQAGYGAFSVSHSNLEAVREYIRLQPEHHAKQSFQEEFREWLMKYGLY